MAQLLCLANSRKHGNRCVAGIDLDAGRLVRPVSDLADGAIPEARRLVGDDEPRPLDVLDVPLQTAVRDFGFQPENRLLAWGRWKRLRRAQPAELLPFCRTPDPLLHNRADRVPWTALQALPGPERRSLELIRVRDARFHLAASARGGRQVRVRFRCADTVYDLTVTDPVVEGRVFNDQPVAPDGVFLVSLGEPFPPGDAEAQCYKLVAGVVELPPDASGPT